MTDPRDLKIALLKAQLERACRYDPEWGPADEDRPLGYIVGAERRALHGTSPTEEICRLVVEHAGRSMALSNSMFLRARRDVKKFDGGKPIIVPLTYATRHELGIGEPKP